MRIVRTNFIFHIQSKCLSEMRHFQMSSRKYATSTIPERLIGHANYELESKPNPEISKDRRMSQSAPLLYWSSIAINTVSISRTTQSLETIYFVI